MYGKDEVQDGKMSRKTFGLFAETEATYGTIMKLRVMCIFMVRNDKYLIINSISTFL